MGEPVRVLEREEEVPKLKVLPPASAPFCTGRDALAVGALLAYFLSLALALAGVLESVSRLGFTREAGSYLSVGVAELLGGWIWWVRNVLQPREVKPLPSDCLRVTEKGKRSELWLWAVLVTVFALMITFVLRQMTAEFGDGFNPQ